MRIARLKPAFITFAGTLLLYGLMLGSAAAQPAVGLLRVHGALAAEAHLDRDALAAIGREALVTETPWTEGETRFVGVPLGALLEAVGARGEELRAVALNDYAITFRASDAVDKGALVAFERDGAPISVRDKGPFWIVFPWSDRPELHQQTVYDLSIWQLHEIEIR